MRIPQHIVEALMLIGVWELFLRTMQAAQSFEQAEAGLERVREAAETAYKHQAFQAHPDRPGGSDERMKALNGARDALKDLVVQRPQPVMTVVRIYSTWTGTATTTSNTYTGAW